MALAKACTAGHTPMSRDRAQEFDKYGKPINEHIPKYIKDKPWYYSNSENDYLSHHRGGGSRPSTTIRDKFVRKRVAGGSQKCKNCNLPGHIARDCLEKPTKKLKVSGKQEISTRQDEESYDEKKDRWFGYSAETYTVPEHKTAVQEEEPEELDTDEEIESILLGIQVVKSTSSGKSVRLREDAPRYLKDYKGDLDTFDPKSRMYKEDGFVGDASVFAKDSNGDASKYEALQKYAKDQKQPFVGNPTEMEVAMNTANSVNFKGIKPNS